MKKIISIGLVCVFLLAGCGKKEETTVCTFKEAYTDSKMTLKHEGDKITKQVVRVSMEMSQMEGSKEDIKSMMNDTKKSYNKLAGVTFTFDIKKDIVSPKTTVDYSKADVNALVDAGIILDNSETSNKTKAPGLKESLKQFKTLGYKCK